MCSLTANHSEVGLLVLITPEFAIADALVQGIKHIVIGSEHYTAAQRALLVAFYGARHHTKRCDYADFGQFLYCFYVAYTKAANSIHAEQHVATTQHTLSSIGLDNSWPHGNQVFAEVINLLGNLTL